MSNQSYEDFINEAVYKVNNVLHLELEKARPTYSFLFDHREDLGVGVKNNPCWILNSLSGKENFLHGLPHFTISIALELNQEILTGVVYDPIKDEMFAAEKGRGSYLNERRIRVSTRKTFPEYLIGNSPQAISGREWKNKLYESVVSTLRQEGYQLREFGFANLDLPYIASGRLDGYIAHSLSIQDIAAGLIILKEAGGYITDFEGQSLTMGNSTVLAGSVKFHQTLRSVIERIN